MPLDQPHQQRLDQQRLDQQRLDQQGLVTARQLRAAGTGPNRTTRAVRSGQLVRVRPAVYAAAALPPWPLHLVGRDGPEPAAVLQVRAVLLSLGPRAAAGGTTAAWIRGWGLLHEPRGTVEVALPNGRGRTGLRAVRPRQRRRLKVELWTPLAGRAAVRVTSALDTVLHCCADLGHREAVVLVDSALRSGQVSLRELAVGARGLRQRRLRSRVLRVLDAADPQCGSVLESVVRLELDEAGLGGYCSQVVLADRRGRRILRADFVFRAAGLVLEADGTAYHPDPARDRALDNRLVGAGWRVLRVTWSLVVHDPEAFVQLVRDALVGTPGMQAVTGKAGRAA